MLDRLKQHSFEIECVSHARAILEKDFPEALSELGTALCNVKIPILELIGSGGGEAKGTQRLRRALAEIGWNKLSFEIRKTINGVQRESISHQVDHVRTFADGVLALEIEWNNKDPFFDRDLENFKRLHAEGAISVGFIVTRGSHLQDQLHDFVLRFARQRHINSAADLRKLGLNPTPRQERAVSKGVERANNPPLFGDAWADHFVSDKFGAATTHWRKLMDRIRRGVGNPCPLVLIGIPASVVTFPADDALDDDEEPT